MEILPQAVFKLVARELLRERKKQTAYYMFLYKAGIFQVGGTSTLEEREAESVKQISEALLKYASFSLAQSIKSSRPLKTLDALYDLFAAFGKAFCVDVEIKSDGKLPQEIKFEGETGFGDRAQSKNLVAQLRNRSHIRKCYLAEHPRPSVSSNVAVMKASCSGSSLRGVKEDRSFGDVLATKPPVVKGSSRQGGAVKRRRLSSSSSSSGSSSCSSSSGSSSSFGVEDPSPPVLKRQKSSSPLTARREEGEGDGAYRLPPPSNVLNEFEEQRRLLKELLEKTLQWHQKLDKHLLSFVQGCQFCPVHCFVPLNKKIKRDCGRMIGKKVANKGKK